MITSLDLMGDGVNIAARLEGIAKPGAICLSEDAYRQVKSRLDLKVSDLGATQLKNIAEPIHVAFYAYTNLAAALSSTIQPAAKPTNTLDHALEIDPNDADHVARASGCGGLW